VDHAAERLGYQSLAIDLSALLLGARSDSIDARVGDGLAKLGEFYGLDRITLRWFDDEQTVLQRTHEWVRDSDASLPRLLNLSELPYLRDGILRREVIAVRRLEELPAEARAEAEALRSLGTRSTLMLPLVAEGLLVGASILSTEREERDWSGPVVAELRLLGEMMASAIARCRAERALRESEERQEALSNCSIFCVWVNDFEGRFLDANEAALNLLGYSREEIGSLSFASLLDEDQLVEAFRVHQEIIETGSMREPLTLRLRTKTGESVWLEAEASLIRRDGTPYAIQGIARDITKRRRAEEGLRYREKRFRDIAENAKEWIWEVDKDGKYTFSSPVVEKLLGYTPEEALQRHFFDFFHPDVREELKELALGAFAWKEPFRNFENLCAHNDGHPVWLSTSGVPILDEQGNLLGYRGADTDITERKRAEERLRASEARYRLVADNATDVIWVTDMDLRLTYMSPSVTRLRGFSVEEVLAQTADEMMAPASVEFTRKVLAKELTIERRAQKDLSRSRAIELELKCKDGSTVWVETNMRFLRDADGKPIAVLGISRDISARKHAEETLARHMSRQSLLAEISAGLLQTGAAEMGRQIELALERVGESYSFHELGLWWFDDTRQRVVRSHAWKGIGVDQTSLSEAPWLGRRALEDRVARVSRLAEIPEEAAAERDLLGGLGIESFLIVPLRVDGALLGFATFSFDHESEWPDELVEELQLVANVLAGAFARGRAMQDLQDALVEVTRLKERVEAENVYLREEVRAAHGFGDLVGESPELVECLRLVERVAPTDSTVLILGETGTGKELIARALHELSPRREGPLVSVNCAALPETLIESELFGHERGAFTGALERRRGRFELASGGTLFLDEIGDLPLPLQGKLLRVLEEGEVERVGGSQTIPVDVRVIGSTHRDLVRAVETGEFRADLYYRIGGFPVRVPPLRERTGDIPRLARHFVEKHSRRLGREVDSISSRTLSKLSAYSWPGNVRELEHVIERGLIAATGPVLDLAEPLEAVPALKALQAEEPVADAASLREVERGHITRVLERTNWVVEGRRGAAELLHIPASTLRSRMKRLGIARPA